FFLSQIDVELNLLKLCLACDCALVGFLVERIAHFQLRRLLDEVGNEILVSGALDEHARATQTNLALVCERRTQASCNGRVEVGVRKNDIRVFPAELERDLLEQWRARLRNLATGYGAASKRDGVDLWMRSDCSPDTWASTMHYVKNAIRQTSF